ncbi:MULTISPECIES: hypothetical protein [unclassified Saccharibacter]|uniref:hypothetical protein n=1 Tax=unclassified Saccharibacter TaxID=2648722 RepID=UPI001326532C|nr:MULTISPECIES: hypothetical protein [unclassified Saccharibacter]MXV36792.1 hypothetical protein [Saccharibacter sp. EH611]MXV58718.1 hypothetical protein [Saccharibacter sp. EH70]MXV66224.1 hypothetical protein [Saccharibacter sp. EH60]
MSGDFMDITSFLDLLPNNIGLIVTGVIIACKLITISVRPPASNSRWELIYRAVSTVALNIGWATNRFQAGRRDGLSQPKK